MDQDIKDAALKLQGFIWEKCPNLKGKSFSSHSDLVEIVINFKGDIDACKEALRKVNTIFEA